MPDAIAAGVFLLLSTGATLGLTQALRLLIDRGVGGRTTGSVDRYFLLAALIALGLAHRHRGAVLLHQPAGRAGGRRPARAALSPRADPRPGLLPEGAHRRGAVAADHRPDHRREHGRLVDLGGAAQRADLHRRLRLADLAQPRLHRPGAAGGRAGDPARSFAVGRVGAPALGPRAGALRRGGRPTPARRWTGSTPCRRSAARPAPRPASRRRWRRRSTPRWRGSAPGRR